MDHLLLQRAKNLGVEVMEETSVADVLLAGDRVVGVRLKVNGTFLDKYAPITIDATGRARLLVRRVGSRSLVAPGKTKLVAFKAHLKHTRVAEGACEIYSYRNGYGGLTRIENDLSNLCFITAAEDVKHFGSDPETVLQEIVLRNRRAAYTLDEASVCSDWLSVSLESFGRKAVAPFSGLLAVGDAAAFIDPFTGSGILMALESGELVAEVILSQQTAFKEMLAPDSLADQYRQNHYRKFHSRLRMARMLRRAAYLPQAADFAIALFGASDRLRRITARATR
jgi:flavin-dependent dehydrogenase